MIIAFFNFLRKRRLGIILVLSLVCGIAIWRRSPPPDWTSREFSYICPLGITSESQVITFATELSGARKLLVWDAHSGKVIHEQALAADIPSATLSEWGEMTPDGQFVILRDQDPASDGLHSLYVIDWRTGKRRCPPIRVKHINPSKMSPDGKYKQLFIELANRDQQAIADLSTGETLHTTVFSIQFSPDSRQWASLENDGDQSQIVFRSLPEGIELGRFRLPSPPFEKWTRLGDWNGDRLEVETQLKLKPPRKGSEYERWSFQVSGTTLSDMRREPALWGRMEYFPDGRVPQTWIESGPGWAVRASNGHRVDSRLVNAVNWCASWIPRRPMFRWSPQEWTHWQRVSRQTGDPLHAPIVMDGPSIESRDGRFLAMGKSRLRLWTVPPTRPYLSCVMAAAAPWLLLLLLRPLPRTSNATGEA